MSGTTPGPWQMDDKGWIESAGGRTVVEYGGCGTHDADWNHADIRLVLAAPELMSALDRLINAASHAAETDFMGDEYHEAISQAVSAVVKARGEP